MIFCIGYFGKKMSDEIKPIKKGRVASSSQCKGTLHHGRDVLAQGA